MEILELPLWYPPLWLIINNTEFGINVNEQMWNLKFGVDEGVRECIGLERKVGLHEYNQTVFMLEHLTGPVKLETNPNLMLSPQNVKVWKTSGFCSNRSG